MVEFSDYIRQTFVFTAIVSTSMYTEALLHCTKMTAVKMLKHLL